METDTKPTAGSDVERGSSYTGSVLPETKEVVDGASPNKHPRDGMAAWRWPCIQSAFFLGGMLLGRIARFF